MSWRLIFTKQAQKDAKKIAKSGLKPTAVRLLDILRQDPYQNPPFFEKLVGDLAGACSRRISIKHRLVIRFLMTSRQLKLFGCGHIMNNNLNFFVGAGLALPKPERIIHNGFKNFVDILFG